MSKNKNAPNSELNEDIMQEALNDAQNEQVKENQTHTENEDISSDTLYYLELAQRIKADFENYKKRNADIAETSFNAGVTYAVEKLLPIVDSIMHAKNKITDKSVLDGIEMINSQLLNSFKTIGVEKIDCVGKQFDPNFHNAVMAENNPDKEDNEVLEEFQIGFTFGKKVIRHSVVKINKLN